MAKQWSENVLVHTKMTKILSSIFVVIAIMTFFGYTVGKDMALRDNARDAALAGR